MPLVLNGPPGSGLAHISGLPGLIDATRRAAAVIGVDSGPLHIAAALGKPGVAIFGPTDPARNGPYGDSLKVLRAPSAETTYKRGASIDPAMRAISPESRFRSPQNRLMVQFPKRYADAVARLRVPSGFLIVVVFAWLSRPTPESLALGVPVSALGLALRAWAAGCLAKNRQLATGGPYAYDAESALYRNSTGGDRAGGRGAQHLSRGAVRAGFPAGLSARHSARRAAPSPSLPRIRGLRPARCRRYCPRLTPYARKSSNPFRGAQYLRNQEYQATAGFVAGVLFLLFVKM